MRIGDKLIELREKAGYDRKTAANALGVAAPTLGHWENNINEPSLSKLEALAKLYGSSIAEIFGEKPDETLSNETKNMLLERVIDILVEDGSLDKAQKFNELDEDSQNMLISAIDKSISKIINNKEKNSR